MIDGASSIWAWTEETGPGESRVTVAICDDDGEPIDDALIWYFWDGCSVYEFCSDKADMHRLEFIDDMAQEHRGQAFATTDD